MPPARPTGRLFAILLAVALPPLILFAVLQTVAPQVMRSIGTGTLLAGITLVTAAWAGVLAFLLERVMTDEARSVVRLAERGEEPGGTDGPREGQGADRSRAADALRERNRQIAELAQRGRALQLVHGPTSAVHHVVETARVVTGDPTWGLAVLDTSEPTLPVGLYGESSGDAPDPLADVHRWAATADSGAGLPARRVEGPWGAFLVVDVSSTPELRAILIAPHEGRAEPSSAEIDLLAIVGEQAATTIEHAMLYRRVEAQATELERLASLQRDFLRSVTHDLQTPLASIRVLAEELAQAASGAEAGDLRMIAHQADRLRRMVGQLLAVSRLEAGVLEPRQEVFRAETIVRNAWAALRADRPFELTVDGVSHLLVADPDRFEQVVWAVLDNAVKYSQPESPVRVDVAGVARDGRLYGSVAVTDEGIGMAEEERAQAFDQFFRAPSARRMAPDGTGIGLHAAQGLVQAMGGSISVASRPGAGTTVTIELPAEEATQEVAPSPD